MKLTPSKMLSSMALATLFIAAAGTNTAMAAPADYNQEFTIDTGNSTQGAQSTQSAIDGADLADDVNDVVGDIQINGTFTKTVTNLPTPEDDGHYLRVTMPIRLDYTYDVDQNQFVGASGIVSNQSIKVENSGADITPQPISMRFVDVQKSDAGGNTTSLDTKFVSVVDKSDTSTLQLPLTIEVSGPATTAKTIDFASIESKTVTTAFTIQAGSNVTLKLDQISGQTVYNADLLDDAVSLARHDLTMQFEYLGK